MFYIIFSFRFPFAVAKKIIKQRKALRISRLSLDARVSFRMITHFISTRILHLYLCICIRESRGSCSALTVLFDKGCRAPIINLLLLINRESGRSSFYRRLLSTVLYNCRVLTLLLPARLADA